MSRDFILVFSGGVVSLMTTLVVLFVMDYLYRREQKSKVDRPLETTGGHEEASKTVIVQAPVARDSESKPATVQAAKANAVDLAVRQAAVEQTVKPEVHETPAQKPNAVHTSPSNVADPVSVQATVDASKQPKTDEQSSSKTAVEQKPEPKVEEETLTKPTVEQKAQPAVVDRASDAGGDDPTIEKPTAEKKIEEKVTEPVAQEQALDRKPQAAAHAEAKSKPAHMVPPEKIKKKTN